MAMKSQVIKDLLIKMDKVKDNKLQCRINLGITICTSLSSKDLLN